MELLIQHTTDDYWIVVRSADGRPPYEQVGRRWPDAASARRFYDTVAVSIAYVSPLRVSDEGSTAVLVAESSSVVLTGRPDRPGPSSTAQVGQLRMEGLG